MRKSIASIIIALCSLLASGQGVHKSLLDNPDLGLHGNVTWVSSTTIRVEYDWSDDSQLADWIPTHQSQLVRGNGSLTIKGGTAAVRSMIWKQLIKCTRIYAEDAVAVNSSRAHLNFTTNVIGWSGYDFNPDGMIGLIYVSDRNYWLENKSNAPLPSPTITLGQKYTCDINISNTSITALSSSDNTTYTHNLATPPSLDRQVAIGGWGGDTKWGKVIIEGVVDLDALAWQPPSGMINIQSCGPSFSAVLEVTGNPTIEWTFDDETYSSSATPAKNYGTIGLRNNLLRVTPWSALTGINLGYDAADGGYGGFGVLDNQFIMKVQNIDLAKSSLRYFCASYSPIYELDLRGFSEIRFVELLFCHNLTSLKLDQHPLLERLCVEENNLVSLDISGCPGLKDFRGAANSFPFVNWGSTGSQMWHLCVRSNPQFVSQLPDLSQFPSLIELLTWDDNQSGAFTCHNIVVDRIDSYDNHYTSADVSGCTNLTQLSLSGSKLSMLNLNLSDKLVIVSLKDCWLRTSLTDYVLARLDEAGKTDGLLELDGNAPPTPAGLTHRNSLVSKGWTVTITEPDQNIPVENIEVLSENGENTITTVKGTLKMTAVALPDYATDTSVKWSVRNGSGVATVAADGTVTAIYNGTLTIRATANDGSGAYGEFAVTISGQPDSENDVIMPIVTGNELRIMLNSNYVGWKAELFSIQGTMISAKLIDSDVVTFDISSTPPGIVVVVLSDGNSLRVTKAFIP